MSKTPRLVLDELAVETLLSLPSTARQRVLSELNSLRIGHPHFTEDFAETDGSGRHISVKAMRPVLVRYWLDGPVDELRILSIQVVKPWRY
jgi:hypothetical protein